MKKNVSILFLVVALCFIIFSANCVNAMGETANVQGTARNRKVELNYSDENFWEWHTRTTTNDLAYNGKHIKMNDAVHFYGYGEVSHKDFLYKEYTNQGEKTFIFKLDETKGNYHTLDGAGFIFNAKKEEGKLTGDVLLFTQQQIILYRLEDVDINTFENTPNKVVGNYAKKVIASVNKPAEKVHKLIVKTSPTNVTVIDNDNEILNSNLDYSAHAGEDFGLIVSYTQHCCSILTEIEFSDFELEVIDYETKIKVIDQFKDPVKGSTFDIINKEGKIIRTFTSDETGYGYTKGLQPGEYTLRQCSAPIGYRMWEDDIRLLIGNCGIILDETTKEEIEVKILNPKTITEPALEQKIEPEPQVEQTVTKVEEPVTILPYAGTNISVLLTAIILSIFTTGLFIINKSKRK